VKTGRSLQELAAELERQVETRKDFVAPQEKVVMDLGADEEKPGKARPVITMDVNGGRRVYGINNHAHGQIASTLGIPKAYYDRMREETPALLTENVNTWMKKEPAKRRLVRTLDGNVRALLSDRYRPLDNSDMMEASLPALIEAKATIVSAEVTETRLHLKAIFPELSEAVPTGMVLGQGHGNVGRVNVAAVILQNSEVGASTLRVSAGFFSTWCTNLCVMDDSSMRKYHIGRSAAAELDAAVELFSNETRKQDDKAFWLKVRDVVRASCNREAFKAMMERVAVAAGDKIESDNLPAVIELTARKFGLADGVKNAVLKHLIQAGDLNRYGLLNAVTRASADVEDYDAATDLERLGGKILELPKTDWAEISRAA